MKDKQGFDVILLDAEHEPEKSFAAVKSLKRLYPHVVVIPISKEGSTDITRETRMSGLGFYDRITKPIRWESLREGVKSAFQKRDRKSVV